VTGVIEGLSHVTFMVCDLERMASFLLDIFDAEEIYSSGYATFSISREKFFLIGGVWIAIMEGESSAERTYNHIAFKIPDEQFDSYLERVRVHGIDILENRSRVKGEGRSIYFYDHDNHLFELHTGTLEQRLERYGEGSGP
jgi:catechol 2,3-dioxygenase-like lactoylglutathione lyase family enzyme